MNLSQFTALLCACAGLLVLLPQQGAAQLFSNLDAFANRLRVGDPEIRATNSLDGPKGIATADFDGDNRPDIAVANTDGTVTVFYGRPQGKFSPPTHLRTGVEELRGITAADVTGDARPDIAVAAPYSGEIFLFVNQNGEFNAPLPLPQWIGVRNVSAGDFDGDGRKDLLIGGTTNGLRQLRSSGAGAFQTITNLTSLAATNETDFPKPLYVLTVFRPTGAIRDAVVATHADTSLLWVLTANANGALAPVAELTNQFVHAAVVGPILGDVNTGLNDLVTASRDAGTIEVRRGTNGAGRFQQSVTQRINVPGGPRALSIADLDGDGWNDLVVVLRNFDRVLTYHNSNGVLVASTEMPVGRSPRELVSADFNADGRPDVAVMNRASADVSVLMTFPGQSGFGALDQIYPVDGGVSGLHVLDFNDDNRDDVIQLHRTSGEFSVRITDTNGRLGPPQFYPMGTLPSAQAIVDVNNDGFRDIVTANLGQDGIDQGSVSVRLGNGAGGFGPEMRYELPDGMAGRLFALVAADFNNDGHIDLAAGFFDCRIAFFRGNGNGTFTYTREHRFVYESRVMVVGDFDKDGDMDLAGAGYAGDVVVIENRGDLLTTETLTRTDYPASDPNKAGTKDIVTTDINGDGDLDLLIGTGKGTMLFIGLDGMAFFPVSRSLPGTDFPASGVALGDFDGDGSRDVAVSCRVLSCVTILRNTPDGLQPALSVDVPSGEFLAAGDLDGDGQDDLVGTGSVLWTALSSRRAQPSPPVIAAASRPTAGKLVINEILAVNTELPLEADGDRRSDWVELFNAGATGLSLNGWRLRLEEPGQPARDFTFPITAFSSPNTHLLVIFSDTRRTLYHTGFRLPGDGATLKLLNPQGTVIDEVAYARQQENISFARYRDGLPAFAANPYPSPGRANSDNGPVEPVADLENYAPLPALPDEPVRFTVTGRDDIGIIGVTVVWKRLDVPNSTERRIQLYDDGEHDDGAMQDGTFAGLLRPGLPDGAEIQFYIEVADLSDQVVVLPDEPIFSANGAPVTLYSLRVGAPETAAAGLEISEVVAVNSTGLRDETGATPDWVEIRNTSANAVPLRGVSLAQKFFGNGTRHTFAEGDVLQPGEYRVIYCDSRPTNGPSHAPFSLSRTGDELMLTGPGSSGARALLDHVNFGTQQPDIALARLGAAGAWRSTAPTPRTANMAEPWLGWPSFADLSFNLAFPTTTNATYTVEATDSLAAPSWRPVNVVPGNGIERIVKQPMSERQFFRVRRSQ